MDSLPSGMLSEEEGKGHSTKTRGSWGKQKSSETVAWKSQEMNFHSLHLSEFPTCLYLAWIIYSRGKNTSLFLLLVIRLAKKKNQDINLCEYILSSFKIEIDPQIFVECLPFLGHYRKRRRLKRQVPVLKYLPTQLKTQIRHIVWFSQPLIPTFKYSCGTFIEHLLCVRHSMQVLTASRWKRLAFCPLGRWSSLVRHKGQ